VVAEDHKGEMIQFFLKKFTLLFREGIVKGFFPDPLDLVLDVLGPVRVSEVRHIMNLMAGIHAFGAMFHFRAFTHVNDHGPSFSFQALFIGGILRCFELAGKEELKCRVGPETHKCGESGDL
jgi:hypothetical protein